jgi:hypothetical protein
MRARGRSLIAAAIGVSVLAGCTRPSELAGTLNVQDFVIAPGQTLTATSDLTITASHKIEIDGTLCALPGANLVFNSPVVQINGRVKNLAHEASWWRIAILRIRSLNLIFFLEQLNPWKRKQYWPKRASLDCLSPINLSGVPAKKPGSERP